MKAVVIAGPTAAGKTKISLQLAQDLYNIFEIVSADSVQVYKFLDIGSGKPGIQERSIVNHHLIDEVDPHYNFSAGDFIRRAGEACIQISSRGKIPLFVGGTGLYLDAFFKGISEIPSVSSEIREKISVELNERGLSSLYQELITIDRKFAAGIHENDKQRILRGLEVFRQTGKPLSSYYDERNRQFEFDLLYIGIEKERSELRDIIDKRVDFMISSGLIDEVSVLRNKGYNSDLKSMNTIGYREINRYLDGDLTIENAVAQMKLETKRYAKRQMTWFRRNSSIKWFSAENYSLIKNSISKHLSEIKEVL